MQTITADGATAPTRHIHHDRLIRLSEVMNIIGFGKTAVYQMVKSGAFPAPCKPGGTASRWSQREVLAWLERYLALRFN